MPVLCWICLLKTVNFHIKGIKGPKGAQGSNGLPGSPVSEPC